jgi:osmotically-inducible protein OsmY
MDLGTVTGIYRQLSQRDEEVQQQINKALASRGSVPLRQVRVDLHEGLVILRGSVSRYYDKQLAQELVKHIDGVEKLKNEIVVQ